MGELTEDQKAVISGLREMTDFLESHPAIIDHVTPLCLLISFYSGDTFKDTVRGIGSFEKDADDTWFNAVKRFGPHRIKFYTRRENVCRQVTKTKRVKVTEWECDSILAEAVDA